MSKISEVQDFIVGYLKENGASYINELYEASGVSKDTFYRALNGLIDEGTVTTYRDGKRRYVKLTSVIPDYLKYIIACTTVAVILTWLSTLNYDFVFVDFGSDYPLKYPDTTFFYFVLMFLIGFWAGIVAFRFEDLESAYFAFKSKLSRIISAIKH